MVVTPLLAFSVSLLITLPLMAFWAWMFRDLVQNESLSPTEKNYWLIAFLFLSILTAGYYYFTIYRERH